ncbi:centromere protein T isoform X6 [Molossus molossus]|uniref:centromere protein T isoform X6 n=1 Tax=Molossus molossus TaxID=27622 RepID=UPI0017469370|nr:centromere protein T isoform X6 [Molossus molossus]
MADNYIPDNEPTTRTLLRRVLDTEVLRTPRRPQSTRTGAQKTLLETPFSMRLRSQTKTTARRHAHRTKCFCTKSIGRLAHIQTSGHLKEQTPRTLLENILLTAPESSMVMPQPMVKPVSASQVVQFSSQESSPSSLELQLPELKPPTTLAASLLPSGKRKKRLKLSVFQQGMDQGLSLSQGPLTEPQGNAVSSALISSLNLTFVTPLLPQSVQRPGLARRPPTHRAVDVGAFLKELQDNSVALALPGDRTPVATLPTDTLLEDTQPFSQPLLGRSPSVYHSPPYPSLSAERNVSRRTRSSGPGLQNNSPGKPAQLLVGKAEEVNALAMGFPNTSNSISGEDELEPLQDGIGEEAEKIMEESLSMSEMKEAAGAQGSARAEEPETHTDVIETEGSSGDTEAKEAEPEGSSGDKDPADRTASPELASNTPEFLQARQLEFLELAPPTNTAVVQTAGSRLRQDPYKTGLSHYAKLFRFYAKMPMEKKALEMVEKCLDKYFQRLCDDLDVFAAHASRKTVKLEDLELLMRRQGLVTDQVSLHVLVERHLPLEYRKLLIPCAFSGNAVFPAQ